MTTTGDDSPPPPPKQPQAAPQTSPSAARQGIAFGSVTVAAIVELFLQLDRAWIPWLGIALLVIIVTLALMVLADRTSTPPPAEEPSSLGSLLHMALRDVRRHAALTLSACVLISLVVAATFLLVTFRVLNLPTYHLLTLIALDGALALLGHEFFLAYGRARAEIVETTTFALLVNKLERLSNDNEKAAALLEKVVDRYLEDRVQRPSFKRPG